jgi:uncharacterized protein (DUF362 family)
MRIQTNNYAEKTIDTNPQKLYLFKSCRTDPDEFFCERTLSRKQAPLYTKAIGVIMSEHDEKPLFGGQGISRRRFISVIGAASAGLAFGACSKKSPNEPVVPPVEGPDSAQVAVGNITSYDHNILKNKIIDMLDQLGGIGDLIKSGDKVGMKINLTGGAGTADQWKRDSGVAAEESFWTHPQIVKVVGELAKDAGASKVFILEAYYDTDSINRFGFVAVANALGGQIINLNTISPYTNYAVRNVGANYFIYKSIYQNAIFEELDCFISLPKCKQHVSAGVTHGMKNLVGTLPQPKYSSNGSSNRQAIHEHSAELDKNSNSNLCRVVLDINQATKIHLTINDAIKTTIGGEGPWCATMQNRTFNKLIISKDVVAGDTISTQVIGFNPNAADYTDTFALPSAPCINYLRKAQEIGLGVNDLAKIEVIEL